MNSHPPACPMQAYPHPACRHLRDAARETARIRRPRRLLAASLAAALWGLPALPARALDVQVQYAASGNEARILVRHVPATEPLGALRLHLRFREAAGAGALTVFPAASGPWSQVAPELRRDGRAAEVLALAPTVGGRGSAEAVTVAEMTVSLAGKGLATAEDLLDSVAVAEAVLPFGGKATLAHRLTTGIGKGTAPRLAPQERVSGSQRILTFTLAREGRVRVRVLDARGRTAVTVFDGRKGPGMQEVVWDGHGPGGKGRPLPAGTWFLRLEAGAFAYDRKLEVSP